MSELDPIAYLVVPQNHPATLSRAASEAMVVLDGAEDAADVLAWCSANNCRAQPVFIGKVYRRGTRCFAIVAEDKDAAFSFRMRWVWSPINIRSYERVFKDKMFQNGQLINGDCLDEMKNIADGSIDMILCDLPYGTTACAWDSVIPFEPLWEQYKRIIKPNGAIVLTAAMPFTASLVMSNPKMFRYSLVWDKVNRYTGALNANRMPLRRHEDVLVFYKRLPTYNKQYREGKPFHTVKKTHGKHVGDAYSSEERHTINDGRHNPCSIVTIKAQLNTEHGLHPTQKPVALFEYLIRTYTNDGETVLDNCSGSGTTAIACENLGRKWVCIERDEKYFEVSRERIERHVAGKDRPAT